MTAHFPIQLLKLRISFTFLNVYILNIYISIYIISSFLPLGPQSLKHLLSDPLQKKYVKPWCRLSDKVMNFICCVYAPSGERVYLYAYGENPVMWKYFLPCAVFSKVGKQLLIKLPFQLYACVIYWY